jgi:hypothetical protein
MSVLPPMQPMLHLNSIIRRPLNRKLTGIFEWLKITEHRLLAGSPAVSCGAPFAGEQAVASRSGQN